MPRPPTISLVSGGRAGIRVFGPVTAERAGQELTLPAGERLVLAALTVAFPGAASEHRLTEVLWRDQEPPRTARQSLQNHVSRLRAKLGADAILHGAGGYSLNPSTHVDVHHLRRRLPEVSTLRAHDPGAALGLVDELLGTVAAPALPELGEDPAAVGLRTVVRRELAGLRTERASLLVELDRPDEAVGELERLLVADPGDERRWELLLVALDRAGRRGEALATYQRARRALIDAYGVEPGPALRDAQRQLLGTSGPTVDALAAIRPFGRDDVRRDVLAAVADGGVATLLGPPGIGKSSVLAAVADAWVDGAVLRVECADNPWSALGPVDALLARLAAMLPEQGIPPRVAAVRTGAEATEVREPGGLNRRVADAILDGLRRLPRPLLVLDDLDRAGPTTSDILARVAADPHVGCVAAGREHASLASTLASDVELVLGGLDADALTALARSSCVGVEVSAQAGSWLHRHTGGHPLYALEVLASLGSDRPWECDDADVELRLSPSLVSLVQARLNSVPRAARPLLDAAAVCGEPVDLGLVGRVVDVAELQSLVDAGIIVRSDEGAVRFAHALLAKVADELVPEGRRLELHHAMGSLAADPAVRAHHLGAAAHLDPDAAITALATAGRAAVDELAHADAAIWFHRAADVAGAHGHTAGDELELRLDACDNDRLAGQPGHAEPLLAVAERALVDGRDDLRRRATLAAVQLGEVVDAGPLQQRASVIAERALALEQRGPWRARLLATASILHSISGEPDRCRTMFCEALATLDADDDGTACAVLPYAYMSLGHPDDLPHREAAMRRLAAASARRDDPVASWEANHLACSVAIARGDGPALRRAFTACVRLLERTGDAGRRWSTGYLEAAICAIDRRFDRAEQLAGEIITSGSGVAPARAVAAASGQLLGLRWAQGRLDELADAIEQLVADQPEIPAWKAAGSLVVASRRPDLARAWLDEVAADSFASLPRDFAWLAGVLCCGAAAVQLVDARRAATVLSALVPYTDLMCWQGTCSYGPVAAVAADLGSLVGDRRADSWRATARRLDASLAAGPAIGATDA